MSIEMSMTTDPAEIRNSADDDVLSDKRAIRWLEAVGRRIANPVTRYEIAGACMALADAEHAVLTAMIATDDIELQEKDATIEALTAEVERYTRFLCAALGVRP